MHVFKFRMKIRENDEFVRDFELLANQTFLNFHELIHEHITFKGKELASFFICNQNWKKQQEITLIDMQEDQEEIEKTPRPKAIMMEDARLKDFIEDPHQLIRYEYNFLNPQVFFLELIKIYKTEKENFPQCTFSKGTQDAPATSEHIDPDDFKEEYDTDFSENISGFEQGQFLS